MCLRDQEIVVLHPKNIYFYSAIWGNSTDTWHESTCMFHIFQVFITKLVNQQCFFNSRDPVKWNRQEDCKQDEGCYEVPSTDPAGPLLFLYWLITPAFFEEWEFRAVYQTKLERSMGQERAWIVSGLLFGLFHIPTDFFGHFWEMGGFDPVFSVLALFLQLVFGFILGVVFTKTRSIYPVIAGHFLFDFLEMVLGWLF